eukprot:gene5453-10960_t
MERGISFSEARQKVIDSVRDALSVRRQCSKFSMFNTNKELLYYLTFPSIVSLCLLFVVLGTSTGFQSGIIVTIVFIIIASILNIWIVYRYRFAEHEEVNNEVERLMNDYKSALESSKYNEDDNDIPIIHSGHAHISIITTFRNGMWQRIPSLLLAEGDVIALMAGDVTPAKVEELKILDHNHSFESSPMKCQYSEILESGVKIHLREGRHTSVVNSTSPSSLLEEKSDNSRSFPKEFSPINSSNCSSTTSQTSHSNAHTHGVGSSVSGSSVGGVHSSSDRYHCVPSDSPDLLILSGDVRCFRMKETPMKGFCEGILSGQFKDAEGDIAGQCAERQSFHLFPLWTATGTGNNMNTAPAKCCKESVLRTLFQVVTRHALLLMIIFVVLSAIGGLTRLVIVSSSRTRWGQVILIPICTIIMCFVPLSLPLGLIAAEVLGTADLLATTEALLFTGVEGEIDNSNNNKDNSQHQHQHQHEYFHDDHSTPDRGDEDNGRRHGHGHSHGQQQGQHGQQQGQGYTFSGRVSSTLGGMVHGTVAGASAAKNNVRAALGMSSSRNNTTTGTGAGGRDARHGSSRAPSEEGEHEFSMSENDEFQEADIEDRAEMIADQVSRSIPWGSRFKYAIRTFLERLALAKPFRRDVSVARAGGQTNDSPTSTSTSTMGGADWQCLLFIGRLLGSTYATSPPLLAIPFAKSRILEVLGSVTMMCFLDDDLICESFSVTEEILLLNSPLAEGDGGRGTVLDLHANPQATGSRFENPRWWTRLSSLKPLGLSAMLTYMPTAPHTRHGGRYIKRTRTLTEAALREKKNQKNPDEKNLSGRFRSASRSYIQSLQPGDGMISENNSNSNINMNVNNGNGHGSSTNLNNHLIAPTGKDVEAALVDHVRRTIPQETLR